MSGQNLTRRQQAEMYLKDPNMRRFLDVLSYTEGTQKNGYNTIFGGGRWEDLSRHPNRIWGRTGDGATSATGRYQFLTNTWNEQAKLLGLEDFGPHSQDLAAVSLIMRRGAVNDILNGDIDSANRKLSKEWTSLPYNNSPHQSQKSTEDVLREWERLGGKSYSVPAQQYDYSTTRPLTIAGFTPPSQNQPFNAAQQIANYSQPNNAFQNYFNQLNGTMLPLENMEVEPPQSNRQKYQNQLAAAFGAMPETKQAIPDHIGDLLRSIYDQTA